MTCLRCGRDAVDYYVDNGIQRHDDWACAILGIGGAPYCWKCRHEYYFSEQHCDYVAIFEFRNIFGARYRTDVLFWKGMRELDAALERMRLVGEYLHRASGRQARYLGVSAGQRGGVSFIFGTENSLDFLRERIMWVRRMMAVPVQGTLEEFLEVEV